MAGGNNDAKHASSRRGRAKAAHDRAREIQQSLPRQRVVFERNESPLAASDEDLLSEDISSLFDDASPLGGPSVEAASGSRGTDLSGIFDEPIPFNEITPRFADSDGDATAGEAEPELSGVRNAAEESVPRETAPENEETINDETAPACEELVSDVDKEEAGSAESEVSDVFADELVESREVPRGGEQDGKSVDEIYAAADKVEKRRKSIPVIIGIAVAAVVIIAVVAFVLVTRVVLGGNSAESANAPTSASTENTAQSANANTNANTNASAGVNTSVNTNSNAVGQATYEYTRNIPEVKQYPTFMGGCEVVALEMFLRAFGYNVTAAQLADQYLEYGSSYVSTYSGDPYVSGAGYPPVMVKCAMSYLASVGSKDEVIGFRGESFDAVVSYVKRGIPVVVWTTISCAEPQLTGIYDEGYEWYENEHNVVVYGVDDDYVYVVDPIDGYTRRDRAKFESVFAQCGGMGYTMNL